MSKMTRESALEYFKELEEKWLNPTAEYIAHISTKEEIVEHGKYFSEALSILAPEPRTEPPGVDEVGDGYGDEDEAWAYDSVFEAYIKRRGKVIRAHWGQHFNAWLPIEALPMPKATDGTATFEKGEG